MSGFKYLLQITGFAILVIIIYYMLRKFLFSKLKISKWVVLAFAAIAFIIPLIFGGMIPQQSILMFIPSGLMVIFLLWFMDLSGWSRRNRKYERTIPKKDDIIIKPKAKPNRVKK